MLRETPIFRERIRIIAGRTYVDWCAYLGTLGNKPIRIYAKTKQDAEAKAKQYLLVRRRIPETVLLNRRIMVDALNALEYLSANGYGESSLTKVAYEYVDRAKALGRVNYLDISLGKMLDIFMSTISDSQKRSYQSYCSAINNLLKSIPATTPLKQVSKQSILEHLQQFSSIVTYNSNHARLRYIFNWCVEEGILDSSPMKKVKPKQVPYREPSYFLPEKVAAIMRAIESNPPEEDGALFFIFGFFCGIRSAEIMRLEWRDIDLSSGFVKVRQPKGFSRGIKPRIVELEPNAIRWIRKYFQPHKEGLIITTRLTKWKKEVLEPLGLNWGNDSNHNVMRHTYATMHVGYFRNAGATALNLGHGHSSAVLERYYMGVVSREVASKYWEIMPTN